MRYDRIFAIVVPKYSNSGERISTDKLSEYAKEMAKEFGGVTVIPSVVGCWVDEETKKLVCEENMVIESALDASEIPEEELKKKRELVRRLARKIGEDLGQYAVMAYEDVVDRVEFIEGKYKPTVPERFKEHDFFKKLLD